MPKRPEAVVFDVIETLFSLEPLRPRLTALGLEPGALEIWFARTLRDGFALAATNSFAPLREIAAAALESLLAEKGQPEHANRADAEKVLLGMAELTAAPDVAAAFVRLREAGVPILTLTNGSATETKRLLEKAGVADFVAHVLSVDDVRCWKPRAEPYLHAAKKAGVEPGRLALVAAHGWDVHGAKRAGLITGWVRRKGRLFPQAMEQPDVRGDTLLEVCDALLARG